MTPEAQRIAIAEACGWKLVTGESVQCPSYTFILIDPNDFQVAWTHSSGAAVTKDLPDYLADLNAMHEAEKVLNAEQQPIYRYELSKLCLHHILSIHATAAQRAEAFLRTLNLWKE